jgi:hypothetical protein
MQISYNGIISGFQPGDVGSIPTICSLMAYSVTVSTKHFDCFSPGSNPSKPTIEFSGNLRFSSKNTNCIFLGMGKLVIRYIWDVETTGSSPVT